MRFCLQITLILAFVRMDKTKELLDSLGQSHIYQDLENFDENHLVYQQVEKLDIAASIEHFKSAKLASLKEGDFKPVSQEKVFDYRQSDSGSRGRVEKVGLDAIANGSVAALIMSGGQGTRLGFNGPKGMFELDMPSKKSIFQIHIERIMRIRELAKVVNRDVRIMIYIMTSDLNKKIIEEYFAEKNYFGYPSTDIYFFEQGLEPAFTPNGKIIIESDKTLSLSPDGNGGLYKAVKRECWSHMQAHGIQHLHIYGIDNVLTKSLDPLFIGTCIEQNAQVGNKVVWREKESEKVGVTAQLVDKMHILEYSEIPSNLVSQRIANTDKLAFGAANICNHYMSVDFLLNVVFENLSSSYHFAEKKIPYYDPTSKTTVTPTSPNGIKLEMFIFDVFPLAERWVVLETDRCDEFAPVKNKEGMDSPDTAKAMMSAQGIRWLESVGATVEGSGLCEISPLLSYGGEGLERFAGQTVATPCYLV